MPYYRNNVAENLPDVGGIMPKVNHLYTAFEQSEDELRLSKLNNTLAEHAGLEFNIQFYFGNQVYTIKGDLR